MPTHSNIHTLNGRSSRHSPSSSQQAVLPAEPYAYIRVSTLPQKMRGFSLPRQFRLCNEAAIADGVGPIPGGNLLHDADSGKNFHRGALQELLHRAGQGRISVVYFTKVDRIGRNARDSLEIVEHLQRCGVKMVILDPRIDTTGMFGKFFFTMLAAMAELEAEWIAERTRGGKIEQLQQLEEAGRPIRAGHRNCSYGLRWVEDHYERDTAEAAVILKIFEWAASGKGGDAIAHMLNLRGIPAPRAAEWNDVTVRKILHSTVYIGQMRRKLDREYVFPCPRFVPDELFQWANEQIKRNKNNVPRNAKHDYLLAGTQAEPLLKCLICHENGREHIMGGRATRGRTVNGGDWLQYRCTYRQGGRRLSHNVAADKIDAAVWEALVAALKNHQQTLDNVHKLQDAASKERQELERELADLEARAAENRAAQERLARLAARGKLAEDIVDKQADELEQEANTIAGRCALLRVQVEQAQAEALPIEDIAAACQLIAESADAFTFEEKRWIVRTLVDTVYAGRYEEDGKVTIRWWFEGKLPWVKLQWVDEIRSRLAAFTETPS